MQTIQVGKFKGNFSAILEQVEKNGEKFIIEYGKKHRKVAVIVPYADSIDFSAKRNFGQMKGKIQIPDDFNKEDSEITSMFYGENH